MALLATDVHITCNKAVCSSHFPSKRQKLVKKMLAPARHKGIASSLWELHPCTSGQPQKADSTFLPGRVLPLEATRLVTGLQEQDPWGILLETDKVVVDTHASGHRVAFNEAFRVSTCQAHFLPYG